jgi:hypothetical protein
LQVIANNDAVSYRGHLCTLKIQCSRLIVPQAGIEAIFHCAVASIATKLALFLFTGNPWNLSPSGFVTTPINNAAETALPGGSSVQMHHTTCIFSKILVPHPTALLLTSYTPAMTPADN